MLPAPSIKAIEELARDRLQSGSSHSVLLIFSSYNGERSGVNFDFLQKVTDYHYHSGKKTDCYCVGYSLYEPALKPELGKGIAFENDFAWPLSGFYPRVFHEIRQFIQHQLKHKWQYSGGIDVVVFPIDLRGNPVNWGSAAIVTSRSCVGKDRPFQDEDHMLRTILNLSEDLGGDMTPDQLDPEITKRKILASAKKLAGEATGAAISGAIGLIG